MGSHSIVNKTRVMSLIVKVVRVVIKATGLVLSHEFFYFVSKDDYVGKSHRPECYSLLRHVLPVPDFAACGIIICTSKAGWL